MSDTTTNLLLPYILAVQARKHVTHNESLKLLGGLVQLSVLDRGLTARPGNPADGDRYIVGSGATGDWAGWNMNLALWTDGAWLPLPPRMGEVEAALLLYNGGGRVGTMPAALQGLSLLGLSTTIDRSMVDQPLSAWRPSCGLGHVHPDRGLVEKTIRGKCLAMIGWRLVIQMWR